MPLSDNISFDENGIYIPQTWLDGTGEGNYTPITADRMNHIEQGIVGLSEAWDSQSQGIRRIVFFRHNTGEIIEEGSIFRESLDISSFKFAKRPIPIALPDEDQFFTPTYAWPSDGNTDTLVISCRADK